ncbi:hypothetical protein BGZ96_001311 [Linnemannia gamsii]|uniref:WD40 repeat-like protein n=1 Tax=Linnemannia gamsii TaxID=64522 RepID=A0ABQ7JMQ9_9FUNG|nr:hypothetical protein BGZ96_001311 [Linnemannia gamsii]
MTVQLPCGDSVWLWKAVSKDTVVEWKRVLVIREFFEGVAAIAAIAWKPNALEFAIGTETGCVQTWRLVDELDDGFSAKLLWSLGHTAFVATDAVIVDAVGLSATNLRLLKQSGANDGSPSSKNTSIESQDVPLGENQDNFSGEGQGDSWGGGWGNFSYKRQDNLSEEGQDNFSDDGQDNFSYDSQDHFSDEGQCNFSDGDQDNFSNQGQEDSQDES